MRLVATAAGTLRILDSGGAAGRPVVLMTPDGPNVIEHHEGLVARLAPHARVVCFDMPGFGHSAPPRGYRHRLEQGAAVVPALMDALSIAEASLFFSCANGLYAIAAARRWPRRVRRLLLAQTPSLAAMRAWTRAIVPWPVRTPVLGQALVRLNRRRIAHNWYKVALADRTRRPEFQRVADAALSRGGCYCLADVVQGLSQADETLLRGVQAPATVLWGDADRSHRHTRAESLRELLPHAEVHHVPGCGHFPDLEAPDTYLRHALAALA